MRVAAEASREKKPKTNKQTKKGTNKQTKKGTNKPDLGGEGGEADEEEGNISLIITCTQMTQNYRKLHIPLIQSGPKRNQKMCSDVKVWMNKNKHTQGWGKKRASDHRRLHPL